MPKKVETHVQTQMRDRLTNRKSGNGQFFAKIKPEWICIIRVN